MEAFDQFCESLYVPIYSLLHLSAFYRNLSFFALVKKKPRSKKSEDPLIVVYSVASMRKYTSSGQKLPYRSETKGSPGEKRSLPHTMSRHAPGIQIESSVYGITNSAGDRAFLVG